MGNKQSVNNNQFWCHFHKTLSETPQDLTSAINNINKLADDLILDYQTNNDTNRACHLVRKLDSTVEELFDSFIDYKFSESQVEEITRLCRRLNENQVLQDIRDFTLDEKDYGEEMKLLPNFGSQVMPSGTNLHLEELEPNKLVRLRDQIKQKSSTNISNGMHKLKIPKFGTMAQLRSTGLKKEATTKHIMEIKEINEISTNSELGVSPPKVGSLAAISLSRNYSREEKEVAKQQIDELFTQMREEYDEQKIDFAHDILTDIKEFIKNENLDKWVDYYINSRMDYKMLMDDIEATYKEITNVCTELEDEEGYQFEKAEENIIVKYKKLPKGKTSLKFEAVLDASLSDLLSTLHETEEFTSWSPYCQEAKEIKRISRTGNVVWMKWDLPKPISGREGLMMSIVFNRMEITGSVLVLSKTVHNDKNIMARYGLSTPANSKLPRMEVEFSGIELIPLSKTKTIFKLVVQADPKIKMVPTSVISWTARKGAIDMFERLTATANHRKARQMAQKGEAENSPFSRWLQRLGAQYLDIQNE